MAADPKALVFARHLVPLFSTINSATKLEKRISEIIHSTHKVKAKDFVKLLRVNGFVMRIGDSKKTHRHYFHSEKPEMMIVVLFSDGEETVLSEIYVNRYLKELRLK